MSTPICTVDLLGAGLRLSYGRARPPGPPRRLARRAQIEFLARLVNHDSGTDDVMDVKHELQAK